MPLLLFPWFPLGQAFPLEPDLAFAGDVAIWQADANDYPVYLSYASEDPLKPPPS